MKIHSIIKSPKGSFRVPNEHPTLGIKRLPRKIKKKHKKIMGMNFLTLSQKAWVILGIENQAYRDYLMMEYIKKKYFL